MTPSSLFEDGQALLPAAPSPTRRQAMAAALGAGFATAAQPVVAQTVIHTPDDGLVAGSVRIPVGDEAIPGYSARPAAAGPWPVVLVVSEIFGVHAHIQDVVRRFARAGYLAVAPDLLQRQGDPNAFSDIGRLLSELIAKVPDAQVMRDLDATLAWAAAQGGDRRRSAVTGFCWGGRITWLYAAHQPDLRAGVAWYGRLVGAASPLTPRHPADVAADLKAPVLGLYGGRDTGIPLATVDTMKAALAQGSPSARASEIVVYPEAPHAFHADYRPSYVADAAQDGWRRCLAWFKGLGAA